MQLIGCLSGLLPWICYESLFLKHLIYEIPVKLSFNMLWIHFTIRKDFKIIWEDWWILFIKLHK